jgi:uncharacterized protein (TIGR00255 family)
MPLASMTGFAHAEGTDAGLGWAWELRSVNGRGLDLRMRVPPGWDALEPALRDAAGKLLKRGNVTANLTIKREATTRLVADPAVLDHLLALAMALHARLPGSEMPRADALLALPGVLRPATAEEEERPLAAVQAGFARALAGLVSSRAAEGARLDAVLSGLLAEISTHCAQAKVLAAEQPAAQRNRLTEALAELLRDNPALPEERRRSRCSPPARTCARNSTGWTATSPPHATCWRRVLPSAGGSISWCRSSTGRPTRCAANRCRPR